MNTRDKIIKFDECKTTDYFKTNLYTRVEDAYAIVKTRINSALACAKLITAPSNGGEAATVLRHIQLPKIDRNLTEISSPGKGFGICSALSFTTWKIFCPRRNFNISRLVSLEKLPTC